MNSHLPYALELAKIVLVAMGLAWAVESGWGASLAASVTEWTLAWPPAAYPVGIFFIAGGALLLVFPLTLAGDHIQRMIHGEHEDAPVGYWLRGYFTELLVGVLFGSAIYAAMVLLPAYWWLLVAAILTGLQTLVQSYPAMVLVAQKDEEDDFSKTDPDSMAALRPPLEALGITLSEVRVFDEREDEFDVEEDVVLVRQGRGYVAYLSSDCAHGWDYPEIIASVLHGSWLIRRVMRLKKMIVTMLAGVLAFGGYVAVFPLVQDRYSFSGPSDVAAIPFFLLWLVVALFGHNVLGGWLRRRWVFAGDDMVIDRMDSPNGLIAALEHVRDREQNQPPIPSWAEWLLPVGPDFRRRIARIKQQDC